jgi:acetyl-CoA carboxylase carboxyl transferase subunit beta
MTQWFRRKGKNIKTFDKRDTREGEWQKCPSCGEFIYKSVLKASFYVCNSCKYHYRLSCDDYIKLFIDNNEFTEIESEMTSSDPLNFSAEKSYVDQLNFYKNKTGMNSAIKVVEGSLNNNKIILGAMDFSFIGGSMGSVVGSKIGVAIDRANESNLPLVIVTASGGARMQEGAYSLMQLAKTSTKLARFSDNGGLYIVVLTDPTTGGISASIAMLGDVIIAEPNALIGFAGPRVIKQTIGQDLPEGFQRSEFLLKKGFIDKIVERKKLKQTVHNIINILSIKG